MTYVLGPAAAGKTTLARLVSGLETPDHGEIYFGDRLVHSLPPHERVRAWCSQTSVSGRVSPSSKTSATLSKSRTCGCSHRLAPHLGSPLRAADRKPGSPASGRPDAPAKTGRRLRAVLVTQPSFLVLDEPLGTLEPELREDCWDDLKRVHAETGVTMLAFTDNASSACAFRPPGRDGSGQDPPAWHAAGALQQAGRRLRRQNARPD